MFSTIVARAWIALLAVGLLAWTAACDPADFDQDRPTEPGDPAPAEEMAPADEPPFNDDLEPMEDEPETAVEGEIEDTIDRGWDQTQQGIQQMRRAVEQEARETGQDVQEALDDFDQRVSDFEQDIRDAIRDFAQPDDMDTLETDEEPDDEPMTP